MHLLLHGSQWLLTSKSNLQLFVLDDSVFSIG